MSAAAWDSSCPGPRLEVGASWQRTLQDARRNAFGFHMGWQPAKLPLNLRSEFARSYEGSGYWIEGAYRLSQVPFWQKAMRRTEVVARAQQFFVGAIGPDAEADYDLPGVNTREADFGVNYFLRDGMKGIFSYGRQFSPAGNFNQWSFGLAYRFLLAAGPCWHSFGGAMSTRLHPKNWLAVALFAAALVSSLFAGVPEGTKEEKMSPARRWCNPAAPMICEWKVSAGFTPIVVAVMPRPKSFRPA